MSDDFKINDDIDTDDEVINWRPAKPKTSPTGSDSARKPQHRDGSGTTGGSGVRPTAGSRTAPGNRPPAANRTSGSSVSGSRPTTNRAASNRSASGNRAATAAAAAKAAEKTERNAARDEKRNHNSRKPKSRAGRILGGIGKVFFTGFLIMIITGCLVVGAFAVYVLGFVDDEIPYDLDELAQDYTTTIYEVDPTTQERVRVLAELHGVENRIWVDNNQISKYMKSAVIGIEDERFETHNGVDWKRTAGAFVNVFFDVYDTQQGGSTITQQLVKNLTKDDDKSAMRKIREIMRARRVELKYDKDVVLTCYLNEIYLFHGCYGVETAANYYFDKRAEDLDIIESATLAAIIKDPTKYDPVRNPQNNKDRRKLVLKKMLQLESITQEEYDKYVDADLTLKLKTAEDADAPVNSYFVDTVIRDVAQQLVEQEGMDSAAALKKVYTGGYHINTTLNTKYQDMVDNVYSNKNNFPRDTHTYTWTETVDGKSEKKSIKEELESAMVIMDYKGHIVAMAGARKPNTSNLGLCLATMGKFQAGSSTKPVTVYAPALENNLITYGSRFPNQPVSTVNGRQWPKNSGIGYGGSFTVQKALEQSYNTIAVRVLLELKEVNSYTYAKEKFHISTLVATGSNNDMNPAALALGGNTDGVTVLEMTAAFATFGNLGKYYRPTTFTAVYDQKDTKVILSDMKEPESALSEDTANIMNEILQTVITSGTGKTARMDPWPMFGKTGTATSKKSLWFIGGTPRYVAGVWLGFEHPYETNQGTSVNQNLWKKVMSAIHKDLPVEDFPQSELCGYYRYCTDTGQVASSKCPSTAKGWFRKEYAAPCKKHGGSALSELQKPATVTGGGSTSSSATGSGSGSSSKAASSSKPSGTSSVAPSTTPSATSSGASSTVVSSEAPGTSSSATTPSETTSTSTPEPTSSTSPAGSSSHE